MHGLETSHSTIVPIKAFSLRVLLPMISVIHHAVTAVLVAYDSNL